MECVTGGVAGLAGSNSRNVGFSPRVVYAKTILPLTGSSAMFDELM